jgi:DNA-binding LacI/PurR family transcriptional regulator
MVTLKHIAEKAGVTVSVVSRALNPRPDRHARVAPDTKARIEETALALGFRRNRNAEFLKRGKSPVIQVFLPCRACCLAAHLVYGMAEIAENEDFSLSFSYGASEGHFTTFLQHAIANKNCGVLALQPFLFGDFWSRAPQDVKTLNMVFLNARQPLPAEFPSLSVGYQEAGTLVAEYLTGKGCASLAVVGSEPRRVAGFREEAARKAVPCRCLTPAETGDLAAWIQGQPKPVGLFAVTDILALKLIRQVREAGLRIPEDVRIVGHDNREFAAHLDPALTTVQQHYREQGREGIRMIIRMMYGETVPSSVIRPSLVKRDSA